jgi:DNA-binding Lrp family transcriptional regulator
MNGSVGDRLDATDFRVLRSLANEGRVSDVSLGEEVHLSATATARRRKILEQNGVISGYTVNLDLARLGFSVTVLVTIELTSQSESNLVEFEEAVLNCPSMSYCSFVSGTTDFFMMLHVRSFDDYDRVYRGELSKLPNVAKIHSSFVMRQVAQRAVPPVALAQTR